MNWDIFSWAPMLTPLPALCVGPYFRKIGEKRRKAPSGLRAARITKFAPGSSDVGNMQRTCELTFRSTATCPWRIPKLAQNQTLRYDAKMRDLVVLFVHLVVHGRNRSRMIEPHSAIRFPLQRQFQRCARGNSSLLPEL